MPISPLPHRPHIHMHKLVHRIVPNPTGMQAQRGISQSRRSHAGNANIDRLGQHVLAVLSHAARSPSLPQKRIAPRRPVPTDNIDHPVRPPKLRHQRMQYVELLRIVATHVLSPMVAQKMVQLVERRRDIRIPHPIDHIDALAGMQMVQPQMVLLAPHLPVQ